MKILEVIAEPILHGGEESFILNTLCAMDKNGLDIDIFTPCFTDNIDFTDKCRDMGIRVYAAGYPWQPIFKKNIMYLKNGLDAFLKKRRYDIVHIHSGSIFALAFGAYTAKKYGAKKVIVHSHGSAPKINLKKMLTIDLGDKLLRKNADVFCACSKEAGLAKFKTDIVRDKLIIIKNGIDTERFAFDKEKRKIWREKLGIENDEFIIGSVGRLSWEKNHKFLIDVFYEYLKIDSKAKLLLVGDGELRQELKRKCGFLGIRDNVIFAGNVDNIEDYYCCMDLFAFPSVFEGLGISAIEAQASGLPCIMSDNVPKLAAVSENVRSIKTDNATEWAEVIRRYKNAERCSGSECVKRAGFDIKNTAENVRNIYLENRDDLG